MCIYIICFPWTLWNKIVYLWWTRSDSWALSRRRWPSLTGRSFLLTYRVPTGGNRFFWRMIFSNVAYLIVKKHGLLENPLFTDVFQMKTSVHREFPSHGWWHRRVLVFSQPVLVTSPAGGPWKPTTTIQQWRWMLACWILWAPLPDCGNGRVGKWGVNNCGIESGSLLSDKKLSWVPAIDFQKMMSGTGLKDSR